jgi:hypothetical protein
MPFLASEIFSRVDAIVFDQTKVRWPDVEKLAHLNDGQRQIALYRPDATSVTAAVTLTQDSRQSLPAGAMRFLRAVRNLPSGRAIREASRLALDAGLPDWHSRTGAEVEHYIFDNLSPTTFYVYPYPTVPGNQIEVVYSRVPAQVMGANDPITVPDQYANALVDWVLYRCFLKDATYAGNAGRASMHLQAFAADLGVNMQVEFTSATTVGNPPVHTNMGSVNDRGAR